MNSGNLRAGPMWMLGDRSHRSGRIRFWRASDAPYRPNFGLVRPECPDFLKSTRDARGPMFTGLSRLSRVSRAIKRRVGDKAEMLSGTKFSILRRTTLRFEI